MQITRSTYAVRLAKSHIGVLENGLVFSDIVQECFEAKTELFFAAFLEIKGPVASVLVLNVPFSMPERSQGSFREFFARYGQMISIHNRPQSTEGPYRYLAVRYRTLEEANRALQADGFCLGGDPMTVSMAPCNSHHMNDNAHGD